MQNSAADSYPQFCGLIWFWGPQVWSESTSESDSGLEQVYPSCGLSSLLKSNMILLIQFMCCSRLDRQGCGWHLSVVGWIMQGGGTFLRCPLVQMYLRGQVSLWRAQHFFFFIRLGPTCILSNINYTVIESQFFTQFSHANLFDSILFRKVHLYRNDENTPFVTNASRSACIKMLSHIEVWCAWIMFLHQKWSSF